MFDQVNRKHNRSSSPFTTLADVAERRVASTGVDPTIDQRHDSEPMHIMINLRCRTILIKSVWTFVAAMWGAMKTLANITRTKVYGCYLMGLSIGNLKKKREKENRKDLKVKSWGPKAPAANYSHCNLISTSRRIDTGSAISNRLFNMPKPRDSCMWVLKNR